MTEQHPLPETAPSPLAEPSLCILVPVLGRAERALPLSVSIREATSVPHRVLYLCSPNDPASDAYLEISPVRTVSWEPGPADYSKKMNLGYRESTEDFLFLGATDLTFEPGWDTTAIEVAEKTGAGVIGTDDRANPMVMRGKHSTHSLVRRSYIEEYGTIDQPGKMLHEGYAHQFVDPELIETAMHRGKWAFAHGSIVRHHHPIFDKTVSMDETYKRGLSTSKEDQALFLQRRHLWCGGRMRRR